MANSGIIKSMSGVVKAIAVDGTERLLHIGDTVVFNETIITDGAGAVSIWLSDGTKLGLAENTTTVLDTEFFKQAVAEPSPSAEFSSAEDEVAAIQQALANDDSFDPTTLKAPAAGGVPANAQEGEQTGGHSIVDVNYLNPEITPESGFNTMGINNEALVLDLLSNEFILSPRVAAVVKTLDNTVAVQIVDHNGLAVGDNSIVEDASIAVTGNFNLLSTAGVLSISVVGTDISEANLLASNATPVDITTNEGGQLSINGFDPATGIVDYSYLPASGAKDHSAGNDSVIDQIEITLTDVNNVSSVPAILDILITDTAPQAFDNFEQLSQDQEWLVDNVIFNVRNGTDTAADDLIGVDGGGKLTSVTQGSDTKSFLDVNDLINIGGNDLLQFDTDNGTLYIREDGQYWYQNTTMGGTTEVTDTFSYQLVDSDFSANNNLSMSTADLTITQVLGDINTGDTSV